MLAFPKPRPTPEQLIADRGGADPMYANDPGKLLACNKWVEYARPIIASMLVLDDQAQSSLTKVMLDDPNGFNWRKQSPQSRDCEEAKRYITTAYDELRDMLDGIRDAFIADECPGLQDDDAKQDEADDFSDWLRENTIGVDEAVKAISDEAWRNPHA